MTKDVNDKDLGGISGAGGEVVDIAVDSTTGGRTGLGDAPASGGGGSDHSEDITNDGANPGGDDGIGDISQG